MFNKDIIKTDSKKLHSLQDKKKELDNHYYDLMDQYNCLSWPGYYSGNVEHLEDRFRNCKNESHVDEMIDVCREIEKSEDEINIFIENQYAKDVFERYVKQKPQLIRNKTKQLISWDEAFGDDFNELGTNEKNALVGLIEGQSKYQIA